MRTIVSILLAIFPALAFAQAPDAAAAHGSSSFNTVLILLLTLATVLLFAVAVLTSVLIQLVQVYRGKLRTQKSTSGITKTVLLLFLFLIPSFTTMAQDAEEAPAEVAKVVSPYIGGILRHDFYYLAGLIGLELVIVIVLLLLIRFMVGLIHPRPHREVRMRGVFKKPFLDRFNKSVTVENEQSIELDHDYDGIRELDNDLPPWWKYGFYLTIVIAVVYMWYYHVGGGPNQIDEYHEALAKGEAEKAAYLAKSSDNVDESNVTMVLDKARLENAAGLFKSNCAACHGADGGGSVGPNLTDDYWLHGGTIQDVFKTIKYGVPDKGMKSWKDDFSPKQIADLASYVKSLKGTHPVAPKEKQGELFIEGGDAALDSVSAATEPSAIPNH